MTDMDYSTGTKRLADFRSQISSIREEMRKVRAAIEPQEVKDYTFATDAGDVPLSKLFGKNKDLVVIHNMGSSCPYCTLWADGYNGIYEHLASRAAFVVASPDPPAVQHKFAASRGWKFPMVSHNGTSFAEDMGYRSGRSWRPGISVFRREGKRILRVSDSDACPGDDFCTVWHIFDLLPDGPGAWKPEFGYPQERA
jgi:predicted dithiol-disulfide oxidoreductase (DUF899 family)